MTDDWLDFYLDNILKASGSALKHYSMQKTKDDMRQALRLAIAGLESQEPVAWMFQHNETGRMNYVSNDGIHNPNMFLEMNPRYALVCPLYTHPPQRTWVGLTGEMLLKAAQSSLSPEQYDHFEAMSKYQPDIYDRLAYAIRVQDE